MARERRTRRQWLVACAGTTVGMAALAGCTSGSDGNGTSPEDDPGAVADDGEYGAWPMVRYNSRNRLSVPHDGLNGEPEIEWTVDLESPVDPPVVYDEMAFVSHSIGKYTAIDLSEGEIVWEHETDDMRTIAVSEAAVFVAGDGVEALDHDEGDVQWTTGHDPSVETLRIYDGQVYAGLEDRVIVLDAEGDEQLEFEAPETVLSLAIDSDQIYVRSRPNEEEDEFVMTAYDHDTGEQLWEHSVHQTEQWFDDRVTRTFPVIDQSVYTVDENEVIAIDGATGEREAVATFDEGDPWTRPTIHHDRLYIRTTEPVAYDLETDSMLSEWDPEVNTRRSLVLADDEIYTTDSGGVTEPQYLVSMDATSGDVNWDKQSPEQAESHLPIVLNGLVLLPIDSPGLVAFS
ncbi:outer membrane protein assembly factor BamB family protein [Halopiger goleimassiliensis]|uniref:outer membrane protein assembly factor BamB family protein n=1 Tax=Halopiger goleimassiliensis TaxID=1293048 RepID=UPI0009DB77F2|nr:PQQ-binding-like beta-propeller repeat protein [Halopiger goleimassiliensis]